jgi:hypothetical protein
MRRSVIFCAVLVLSSAAFGQANGAASASPAHPTTSFTLPFDLVDNRVFIEVRLNGRGPFHLLLDSGAGGVTVSADVAQQLGLQVADAGEGQGVGEKTVHAGQTEIAQLRIGDLTLANVDSNVMDLSDAPQVFGTKPFDGIIGSPVFERMVVKHDYGNRMLTFTAPSKFDYTGAGLTVHFGRPRQIPVVAGVLDGVPGNFGVDTGARSSLLLYGPFCAQNNMQEKYGARLEGVTGWGIGGPVRSLLARASTLQIGDISVRDLVIRLSAQKTGLTTSSAMAGLIGPDVLSQFDVTFDYARTRIIFEKNKNYGRRDSYDRAGIWMGQAPDGKHFTVVDVIAGGPGADAGVKLGDQILAINGESTVNLILPGVRETIRRKAAGDKLTLLLESEGKLRIAVVILKDLV